MHILIVCGFIHLLILPFICRIDIGRRRIIQHSTWFTLSFLSCLAYGKHGITAVTRDADAILHAFIIINNSIRLSFISPEPDCTMYTSSPRTDSPISTLQQKKRKEKQTFLKLKFIWH